MKTLPDDYKNYSLSHGTMREEDLIPTFANFLESHSDYGDFNVWIEEYNNLEVDDLGYYVDLENAAYYLLQDLFDTLNNIAPKNCYFGSHPGDGSDYGFWEIEEEDQIVNYKHRR